MSTNIAVLGSQWGDEGKGKIVDYICRDIDVVARYQGGANAGHTVYIKFRRVPLCVPLATEGENCVMRSAAADFGSFVFLCIGRCRKTKGFAGLNRMFAMICLLRETILRTFVLK